MRMTFRSIVTGGVAIMIAMTGVSPTVAASSPSGAGAVAWASGKMKPGFGRHYNRWAANPAITPAIGSARDDLPRIYRSGDHRVRSATSPSTRSYGSGPTDVYLVGDSMTAQWYEPLASIGARRGWRLHPRTRSATPFVFTPMGSTLSDRRYARKVLAQIERDKPEIVIMSTASPVSSGGIRDAYRRLKAAGVKKVIVIADIPKPAKSEPRAYQGIPRCLATARRLQRDARTYCAFGRRGTKDWDGDTTAAMREAVAGTQMSFISMNRLINYPAATGRTTSPPVIGNVIVLRDRTHLTNTFARSARPHLEYKLRRAGAFSI